METGNNTIDTLSYSQQYFCDMEKKYFQEYKRNMELLKKFQIMSRANKKITTEENDFYGSQIFNLRGKHE